MKALQGLHVSEAGESVCCLHASITEDDSLILRIYNLLAMRRFRHQDRQLIRMPFEFLKLLRRMHRERESTFEGSAIR